MNIYHKFPFMVHIWFIYGAYMVHISIYTYIHHLYSTTTFMWTYMYIYIYMYICILYTYVYTYIYIYYIILYISYIHHSVQHISIGGPFAPSHPQRDHPRASPANLAASKWFPAIGTWGYPKMDGVPFIWDDYRNQQMYMYRYNIYI